MNKNYFFHNSFYKF